MDPAIAVMHPRLGDLPHPLLQVGLIRRGGHNSGSSIVPPEAHRTPA